jgi:type I restriction enzyme M protein
MHCGALARWLGELKADLKSIAASGWGAELIPDVDILESQFPELLADLESKRARLAELSALFAAADEEDYEDADDTGVLPGDQVKALKAALKQAKGSVKLAKRDSSLGDWREFQRHAEELATQLDRHKALEDEARQLKADLRTAEKKQDELVAAARAKISANQARSVILERMQRLLVQAYQAFLRADLRACVAALENLHRKYAVTAKQIETQRDAATERLSRFLAELGYA